MCNFGDFFCLHKKQTNKSEIDPNQVQEINKSKIVFISHEKYLKC